MDFRKIDVGKMVVRATEGNLVSFVREIMDVFEKVARQHNITFRFLPAEPVIRLWFDDNVLDKVFFNLLSDAFKYTPDGGHLTVSIQVLAEENQVRVSVEDSGPGIAEADQPHLFEWFYQGNASANGSGIGLVLAEGLTRLHQGQGTTFEVTLPLQKPATFLDAEPSAPAHPTTLLGDELTNATDLPPAEPSAPARTHSTVLVIEDNTDVRNFLSQKLQPHFQVTTAADGAST